MKVGEVIPCICTENASGYDGMPILRVYNGTDAWFDAKCPNCGRGGLLQFRTTYRALREWNEMQTELRKINCWEVDE